MNFDDEFAKLLGMLLGYARVSTLDQNPNLQLDALQKVSCDRIYTDKASGAKTARPELTKLLEQARAGDTIVIWKLDRLGRSLTHLVDLVAQLNERGIGLRSLQDPIDTTTAQGKLVFNIFASLAQFEREVISERTQAGLAAARARGRVGGRKKGLSDAARAKAAYAASLYRQKRLSINAICETVGISRATLYKYLRLEGIEPGSSQASA